MLLTLSILVSFATDLILVLAFSFYFLNLKKREKQIKEKENAIDNNYHHVVDQALSKERKILEDATNEADQIITDAQYLTHISRDEVNNAIKQLVTDIEKEGHTITQTFTSEYAGSLKQLTMQSLNEFHTVMTGMEQGLKKQIADFHQNLLPGVEKELEIYKQERMKQIDQTVMNIIQKASQEIFNRSLSVGDHQNIVTESLEKAKKEGLFD